MSNTEKTGGPAFPVSVAHDRHGDLIQYPSEGMALRDYFAAKALQGILADPNACGSTDELSAVAYKYADAMLKAREA